MVMVDFPRCWMLICLQGVDCCISEGCCQEAGENVGDHVRTGDHQELKSTDMMTFLQGISHFYFFGLQLFVLL